MRHFIVLFFLLTSFSLVNAQQVLKGTVTDESKHPIENCTVLLLQNDSIVAGAASNDKGQFRIANLQNGSYQLTISAIGYHPYTTTIDYLETLTLPAIRLKEEIASLDEVTVVGDRREMVIQRAGKTTYFLSERAKKESDAYRALFEVPKLIVDPLLKSIKFTDGQTPLILIDGVRKPGALSALNPELIESVEVVENPSAKYLASENITCILNLHLKKGGIKPYVRGNLGFMETVDLNFGLFDGSVETGTENTSFYAVGQHFYDKQHFETTQDITSSLYTKQMADQSKAQSSSEFLKLGGDKKFSDKNYLAYTAILIANPSNKTQGTGNGMLENKGSAAETLTSTYNGRSSYYSLEGQVYQKHNFSKNESLETTAVYSYTTNSQNAQSTETTTSYNYNNFTQYDNSRQYGDLRLDYSNSKNSALSIEGGYAFNYANTKIGKNDEPNFSHHMIKNYAYVGIDNSNSSSKFGYSASLGLDMVHMSFSGEKNNYITFMPVISFMYSVKKNLTMRLSFNRNRISPEIGQLNPYNTSTDTIFVSKGNPYLKPAVSNRFRYSIDFMYKKLTLTSQISYTFYNDAINKVAYFDNGVYVSTYDNNGSLKKFNVGLNSSLQLPFGGISAGVSYNKLMMDNMSFNGKSIDSWIQAYFFYKSYNLSMYVMPLPVSYGRYSKSRSVSFANIEAGKTIFKNWMLRLSLRQILQTRSRNKTWVINDDYESYSTSYSSTRQPQILVGVMYNFMNKVNTKYRNKKQLNKVDEGLKEFQIK